MVWAEQSPVFNQKMMQIIRKNKIKIFFTVLVVYLFYLAPGYLSSNVTRNIDLAKAMVDDRTFAIDKYVGNTRDWARYEDHYYAGGAPGLGIMAAPLYFVIKPFINFMAGTKFHGLEINILNIFFTLILSTLPGAVLAVLFYDFLAEFRLKEAEKRLLVFTLAFGTLLFYYSARFVFHTFAAFALFSSFYIIFKYRTYSAKKSPFFLAGVCLGLAFLTEYTVAFGVLLISIYAFRNLYKSNLNRFLLFACGLALPLLMFAFYHYMCFGSPFVFASRYSRMLGPMRFELPKPEILFGLSLSPYRGFLLYMPIFFISFFGLANFFRKPDKKYVFEMALIVLFVIFTFFAFAIACNRVWPLGGSFGPRHFISLVPFLMIPAIFAFKRLKYSVIFSFSALSIFINWCGAQYGDADNVLTDAGLFVFMGLNSPMAEWLYRLTNIYVRQLNVVTHFSPLIGFIILLFVIYLIWKKDINQLMHA